MPRLPGNWYLTFNERFPSLFTLMPIQDMKEHERGVGCWCHPVVEKVLDEGTGEVVGSVTRHNALDGRE